MSKKTTLAVLATGSMVLGAIGSLQAVDTELNYQSLGSGSDVRAQVLDGGLDQTVVARTRGGRVAQGSCGEGKCGEGKCGEKDKSRRRTKKRACKTCPGGVCEMPEDSKDSKDSKDDKDK